MVGYIDPQTGSMIWQGIVAGILGAGVAIKVFWRRIVRLFSRNRTAPTQAPERDNGSANGSVGPAPVRPQSAEPVVAPAEKADRTE